MMLGVSAIKVFVIITKLFSVSVIFRAAAPGNGDRWCPAIAILAP